MAVSRQLRTFLDENGNQIRFSPIYFRNEFNHYKSKIKKTRDELCDEMADRIGVSAEAIKNWLKGKNGPSDLGLIKEVAAYMSISYQQITENSDNTRNINSIASDVVGTDEKSIIVSMYKDFVDYIYTFLGTYEHSYAYEVLDCPEDKQREFIMSLYKNLDYNRLFLSDDTYHKLRTYITELNCMSGIYCMSIVNRRWEDVSPFMKNCYPEAVENKWEFLTDIWMDNREVIRIFFEDMPEWEPTEEYDGPVASPYTPCTPIYEICVREITRAMSKLFKQDFPQYFN